MSGGTVEGVWGWVAVIPIATQLLLVGLVPGWLVVRALGCRGLEALAVAPAVSVSVTAVGATVAARLPMPWNGWASLGAGVALAAAIWGALHVLVRPDESLTATRRLLGSPSRAAALAVLMAMVLSLAVILPAIGRPSELVDSPDAVYHLNRVRLFVDTGNYSVANPTFYPNGFHSWIAAAMSLTGSLVAQTSVLAATNVATILLAALVWPLGCVALVRNVLGRSRLVTLAAGVVSAGFVSFPTMLLGWGVLWPNLMGTALTPGALALLLHSVRTRRRGQVLGFVAALPGIALVQPNAVIALLAFALVWFVTAHLRAGVLGNLAWSRVGRDVGVVLALVGMMLWGLPRLSARVASTAAYQWENAVSVPHALLEVVGGQLWISSVLWGLMALLALGSVWIVRRARKALPVLAMWVAAVALFVVAASYQTSWGALLTGYWYNDKVRIAALSAVPGVVIASAAAPVVRAVLTRLAAMVRLPGAGTARTAATVIGPAALVIVFAASYGMNAPLQRQLLRHYFSPSDPEQVILSTRAMDELAVLARLIPAGEGVVARPESGTPLMYALFGTNTLYRSIPIPDTGDDALIGTGFADLTTRPDVCAALARHDVRWAIDSPHVYWLDRPERSSGLIDLDTVSGLQKVQTVGAYALYRISGCPS